MRHPSLGEAQFTLAKAAGLLQLLLLATHYPEATEACAVNDALALLDDQVEKARDQLDAIERGSNQ